MKKKSKKKGTVIGALVMTGVIVLSIPLGVNRSFARLREDVENEYYYDSTGYALYAGIDARISAAKNLLTLAEKYEEQDAELDVYMDNLEYMVKQCENLWFDDIEDIGETVKYNSRMGEEAQKLADYLETMELAEKDKKYPGQLMADMNAEQDKLERSSFNDKVIAYNEKRNKFPASVLAPLAGVKEIVPFGAGSGLGAEASPDEG